MMERDYERGLNHKTRINCCKLMSIEYWIQKLNEIIIEELIFKRTFDTLRMTLIFCIRNILIFYLHYSPETRSAQTIGQ
jgi:hypothetical protein